jgi:hypothetical protein
MIQGDLRQFVRIRDEPDTRLSRSYLARRLERYAASARSVTGRRYRKRSLIPGKEQVAGVRAAVPERASLKLSYKPVLREQPLDELRARSYPARIHKAQVMPFVTVYTDSRDMRFSFVMRYRGI